MTPMDGRPSSNGLWPGCPSVMQMLLGCAKSLAERWIGPGLMCVHAEMRTCCCVIMAKGKMDGLEIGMETRGIGRPSVLGCKRDARRGAQQSEWAIAVSCCLCSFTRSLRVEKLSVTVRAKLQPNWNPEKGRAELPIRSQRTDPRSTFLSCSPVNAR